MTGSRSRGILGVAKVSTVNSRAIKTRPATAALLCSIQPPSRRNSLVSVYNATPAAIKKMVMLNQSADNTPRESNQAQGAPPQACCTKIDCPPCPTHAIPTTQTGASDKTAASYAPKSTHLQRKITPQPHCRRSNQTQNGAASPMPPQTQSLRFATMVRTVSCVPPDFQLYCIISALTIYTNWSKTD